MPNVAPFPGKALIREQAAEWLVRLDRGALSADEQARLRAWLAADEGHRAQLIDMARLWGQMDCLAALADECPLRAERAPGDEVPPWWRRPSLGVATFASVVGAALLMAFFGKGGLDEGAYVGRNAASSEIVFRTRVGEQSRSVLQDGSALTLNTGSTARVRLAERSREVFLDAGEAYFEVSKDPGRPFLVHAGSGQVKAIGTAFSVRLSGPEVAVVVREGTVQVSTEKALEQLDTRSSAAARDAMPAEQQVTLSAGKAVRYGRSIQEPEMLDDSSLAHSIAWTDGKWAFSGETLAEVVSEINRYTETQLVIEDPAIADVRIGGYFDVGDLEPLLAALDAGFAIRSTRTPDNRILLRAR